MRFFDFASALCSSNHCTQLLKYPDTVLTAAGGYETTILKTDKSIIGFGKWKKREVSLYANCETTHFIFNEEENDIIGDYSQTRYKKVKSARK